MKIISISAVSGQVYGLGADGLLYIWNSSNKDWQDA